MSQVTFTEREAIRKMLDYLQKEKERIYNQEMNLLDRLRELDNIEEPKAEIPSLHPLYQPDYSNVIPCNLTGIELEPEKEWTPCEWAHAEESEAQNVETFKELEQFAEKSLIPKTEIEALKDKDQKNNPIKIPTRNSNYRDVKVVAQYIKAILKENEVPMKTSDLIEKLKETGINISSPYVLLAQATKYEPRIQKAKFGYYQYKW